VRQPLQERIVARHAHEHPARDDGEVILVAAYDLENRAAERLARGEDGEVPAHGVRGRGALQRRAGPRQAALLAGAEEDEEPHQQEPEVVHVKAEDDEAEGQRLADPDGPERASLPAEDQAEEAAEDAAAVHGKGGNEVEGHQDRVDHEEGAKTGAEGDVGEVEGDLGLDRAGAREEERRQHGAHEGPRQGDEDLLVGLPGNLLQERDAADGQEHDAAGVRPEEARDEAVADLVGQDAGEEDAGQGHGHESRGVGHAVVGELVVDVGQEEEEGEVDLDGDPEDAAEREGPAHRLRLSPRAVARALPGRMRLHERFPRRAAGSVRRPPSGTNTRGPRRPYCIP